jgi:competence protein ComEC
VRRLVVLVAAVYLLSAPGVQAQFKSVRVQVIDRGQADGILIRTPNSQWVVIDAGADNQQADAMAKVWSVEKLALVITSHRHADHYGGMARPLRCKS